MERASRLVGITKFYVLLCGISVGVQDFLLGFLIFVENESLCEFQKSHLFQRNFWEDFINKGAVLLVNEVAFELLDHLLSVLFVVIIIVDLVSLGSL